MDKDIAITGIACRFPGANTVSEYWDNIRNGVESIRSFSLEELAYSEVEGVDPQNSNYIRAKGFIEGAEYFSAEFFGYSAYEAKLMDPQHRILLETAYHALENGNLVSENFKGTIGSYLSAGFNTYLLHCLTAKPNLKASKHHYQLAIGNANDFLATRIAYKLNLTGPAQTIQTACSSSLVAVYHACQSLLNHVCDAALAGGVCITVPLLAGYLYKTDGIASPDGHCRPFDKEAAGTVPGNGSGVVVLKRLEDALAQGDHIYAIIKGSAINNDGSQKISYTAPSVKGQERAIRMAHEAAGVTAESIGYIEAHGTGTAMGDPIEIEALKRAFGAEAKKASCAVGSVKANIGHLDAASGIAGLIKTAMILYHRQLPPQINYGAINPRIALDSSPFYVNTALKPWDTLSVRRAGVSSFGIGGTNAHVILEAFEGNQSKMPGALSVLKRDIYWLEEENPKIIYAPVLNTVRETMDIAESLTALLTEYLELDSISPNQPFEDMGIDSLLIVELILLIEERLGYKLSMNTMYSYPTITRLSQYMSDHLSPTAKKAFSSDLAVDIKNAGEQALKMFFIHPAGGSIAIFKEIAEHMDGDYHLIGIQAQGWDGKETPDQDIKAMAARYVAIVQSIQSEGPYYFCGSSLGGTIAFEMAQLLTESGHTIGLLALIDSPGYFREQHQLPMPQTTEEIHQYIAELSPKMAANLSQNDAKNSLVFCNLWKSHALSLKQYAPSSYLGKAIYFIAQDKNNYMPENMVFDWVQFIKHGIEIFTIPGNHISMHSDTGAIEIAKILTLKTEHLLVNRAAILKRA